MIIILDLKTSKVLLKSQAHQVTSLFTSAAMNQRGVFQEGDQEKLRSDFQGPEGDRVAVKVGVVQMGRVNDQMGQNYKISSIDQTTPLAETER